ncbi:MULTISPECIES: DcaP family trimeric outer membrane transporter [unclassified Acinetobacter]|uniref:DcaP family trimeric outer membrane transporter n=1 Tax=unclassified Acinetobacter TaxID=196816 RepID=UPI00190C07DD|nr:MULTISPECIES: DcaP family trimeric outer membrane transporter [unclassified Acinetobacter]MBK0063846.1 TMF family protein [Acinetobacter sp. S55]MBK0067086.1 TMF family protein [Acinetobacter sp. S54]
MKKSRSLIYQHIIGLGAIMIAFPSHAKSMEEQLAELKQQIQALELKMEQQAQQQESKENQTKSAPLDLKHMVTKGGAELELYGNVRADGTYQMKGPNTMYNYISSVPLKGSENEGHNSDKFLSTLNATRFGFNFTTPNLGAHRLGGKVEMDFFGGTGRDTFRIRHAYLTYDKWLVGQTWSNFNAVEYFPETVDASLSVGGSLTRVSQIKYSYPIDKNMNLAVSLEDPKAETVTTSGTQDFKTDPNAKLKMPSAVGRLNYKFENGSIISGRVFLTQKATTFGNGDDFLSWGAALGGKYQITADTLLRFDYNHIKGDTKNVLWSNYAYVFDANEKMKPNEFDTLTVGLTHQFTPKIRSTLGFGYMLANDDNSFAQLVRNDSTQNKELKEGWINIFYNPVKPVNFGLEYMYGERKTFADQKGIDNRVNVTAIYDF